MSPTVFVASPLTGHLFRWNASSPPDDEEVDEQQRSEYLEDMGCLEKYFSDLKEMWVLSSNTVHACSVAKKVMCVQCVFHHFCSLYRERIVELDQKMKAVEIGMQH